MAEKCELVFRNDTITLSKCRNGFWLYDKVAGMNLSMEAETEQNAFIETIMYYQKQYVKSKESYKDIYGKVKSFVEQFIEED